METVRAALAAVSERHTSYSIYRRQNEQEDQSDGMKDESGESAVTSEEVGLIVQRSQDRKKALMYLVLVSLFLLIIAFILGYVSSRGNCTSCAEVEETNREPLRGDGCDYWPNPDTSSEKVLYWGDLKAMLKNYLDGQEIAKITRIMSNRSHPAGSPHLHELTRMIHGKLKSFHLNHVWADSHYVTLPFPNRSSPSYLRVTDENGTRLEDIVLDADAYLAYSPRDTVSGGLVYGHYGRAEDFARLSEFGVSVKNNLVILRVGKSSFGEKVALAEQEGAIGVLIYPDPVDLPQYPRGLGLQSNTAISGHVHRGTGDPFTPGFPSFNHTQFPPMNSSALPQIVAQPISVSAANNLLRRLGGHDAPPEWRGRHPSNIYKLGPTFKRAGDRLQLAVTTRMVSTVISNVFGSIEGFAEPDRYIIFGAQRDSWSEGAAKSGVGTAILLELARAFSKMVENGFKPRRSLLFASWDAGEFGSVGATEWLEGYLTMMHLKAVAYFSLDKAVLGDDRLHTESSPLLHNLIETVIKQVESPKWNGQTIYSQIVARNPDYVNNILKPLTMDSSAYPFTAFAGVPAMELSFREQYSDYWFLDTKLDTYQALEKQLNGRLADVSRAVAEVMGQMAIILTHNDRLHLNYQVYSDVTLNYLTQLQDFANELKSRGLTLQWLYSARGDFIRSAERLTNLISSSDEGNERLNRIYNDKIMRVEFYFLSQYVSATETPFRHILHGQGDHTLGALYKHFQLLQLDPSKFDEKRFRKQLALVTWTLQGAANALSGDVWSIGNNSF
ncbi:transferrin receptor protein 2 isoform X2 [Scyliorhinus canicula]|uniref:transferrin receptor protein 2 isoform X2 n=1 Tax=Scyliorhinus canicula TaxID=7830 RepID=UPI0018F503EF|nr:transferrin receptor protein 2 isoform X2 [Scyliorhinus canicula]XP_038642906.1 transferrin receptor protein 2 isoform X2 [Scyliorhinus canicula]